MSDHAIFLGADASGAPCQLALARANRHGLVAGATGTGKTVTLQMMAESFARAGVCVFAADIKGDLSGIAQPGDPPPGWAVKRTAELGLPPIAPDAAQVMLWDVYGERGCPIRTTVSELGPVLLARMLDLSPAQEGALTVAFKVADEEGLLLLDLKDLRALLTFCSENAAEIGKSFGLVSPQSLAAIQRKLLQLEMEGAEPFFGEPALDLEDFLAPAVDGRGIVHLLAAERLVRSPRLYATFLLWLMSELWEELPEAGDLAKPKLVFFFDEAHLLFNDAPKALLDRIEQVARLIRSKGVGIYFVTQSPADIPNAVLAQLGNRVQHALRAYTPQDQKAVKAAAASFRATPGLDVAQSIQELAIGEALISTLDAHGAPTPVSRVKLRPPASRVGPLDDAARAALVRNAVLTKKYAAAIDRTSAYEVLEKRAAKAAQSAERAAKRDGAAARPADTAPRAGRGRARTSAAERIGGRVATGLLSTVARELLRGVFGTLKRR